MVGNTLPRAAGAAVLGGIVAYVIMLLPVPSLFGTIVGLVAGFGVALPFIWPEIRLLIHL
jgi:hypothetical protein